MEEYDRLPYWDIDLSEYTDSEYEEDFVMEKKTRKVKQKKVAITSQLKKKYKKVDKHVKAIQEKIKINDLFSVVDEFKKLIEEISRLKIEIEANGYPLNYLKTLDTLNEEYVKKKFKKPSKDLKRQLHFLKKMVKKELEHAGEDLETTKVTEIWEKGLEEVDEEVDETSNKVPTNELKIEEEEEEEEEEERELDFSERFRLDPEQRRKFWLVKKKNIKTVKTNQNKKKQRDQKQNDGIKKEIQDTGEFDEFFVNDKNIELKIKKCVEDLTGYKEEELETQIRFFEFIFNHEKLTLSEQKVGIIFVLLNMRFQLTKTYHPYMSRELWRKCFDSLQELLRLLESEGTKLKVKNYLRAEEVIMKIYDLNSFFNLYLDSLNEEWWYATKLITPFNQDYVKRLDDLMQMLRLFKNSEEYWRDTNDEAFNSFFVDNLFRQLGHYHIMTNDFILSCSVLSDLFEEKAIDIWVKETYSFILDNASSKTIKLKTTLYYIFQLTINTEKLELARNLFLGVSLENLQSADNALVAAFNRALCSLAVKLFQQGRFRENRLLLEKILSTYQLEEMLFQYNPKKKSPLKLEDPTIYMPFHMHLNTEEIIVSYLVSSLMTESYGLFELAHGEKSTKKSFKNKFFARFLDRYNNKMHVNATDNSMDLIFMALRKIMKGEITTVLSTLAKIRYISQDSKLWTTLSERVPLECLNCYLFLLRNKSGGKFQIHSLAKLFKIDPKFIKRELSRKIFEGNLNAKLDLENDYLVFAKSQKSFFMIQNEQSLLDKLALFSKLTHQALTNKESIPRVQQLLTKKFLKREKQNGFVCDPALIQNNMGVPLIK